MREHFKESGGRVIKPHRYEWLWEPLEADPSFGLRAMFGCKAVYLDGKLMLVLAAKEEPWRGMLVCTEHVHQASLVAEFGELSSHPILPKWLYLPESAGTFERAAAHLVELSRRRDPRIGVVPKPKKKKLSIGVCRSVGSQALPKEKAPPVAAAKRRKKSR